MGAFSLLRFDTSVDACSALSLVHQCGIALVLLCPASTISLHSRHRIDTKLLVKTHPWFDIVDGERGYRVVRYKLLGGCRLGIPHHSTCADTQTYPFPSLLARWRFGFEMSGGWEKGSTDYMLMVSGMGLAGVGLRSGWE